MGMRNKAIPSINNNGHFHVNGMNHTPYSSKLLIYENCNSYPHMCLCYWPYSSHLTLQSDTSEGDLWLCSWMEAKEGEVLSHCPLQLIFTQDKASFIHFPCRCFIGLPQNWWAMMAPQFKMELGGVKCRMCRTTWRRRRGTGSVRVRTRKQEGWVDEWRREERKKFQLEQCELELSNKSWKTSQAAPSLVNHRGANMEGISIDWACISSFGIFV